MVLIRWAIYLSAELMGEWGQHTVMVVTPLKSDPRRICWTASSVSRSIELVAWMLAVLDDKRTYLIQYENLGFAEQGPSEAYELSLTCTQVC